ncbi:MAG: hypothetical protein ABR500_06530 [Dermatophilaceae bacterium]
MKSVEVEGFRVTDGADTVLDCSSNPLLDEHDVVALIADAARLGSVSAPDLAHRLRSRCRHPRRLVIELAIGDVDEGAESVLEVVVLRRVIRAHGLPKMSCQVPDADVGDSPVRRDFENGQFGVILELDGRLGHEGSGRLADLRRDRKASASGRVTLRAGWVNAHLDPCDLAHDLFRTFQARGYTGTIIACGPNCSTRRRLQRPAG